MDNLNLVDNLNWWIIWTGGYFELVDNFTLFLRRGGSIWPPCTLIPCYPFQFFQRANAFSTLKTIPKYMFIPNLSFLGLLDQFWLQHQVENLHFCSSLVRLYKNFKRWKIKQKWSKTWFFEKVHKTKVSRNLILSYMEPSMTLLRQKLPIWQGGQYDPPA